MEVIPAAAPARKRETRQVLDPDPVRIAEKRRKYEDGTLEEAYKNVSLDDPTTATVSDPVTKSSAEYEVKQSGAQLPVLAEARLFTSSDISALFDGSVSSSLGAMRPLVDKLDILLAPAQEYYKRLPKRIKEEMDLLKDDVEVISYYLDELSEVEDPPPMAMCWMNEARELSYDMEDYIDSLLFVPPDRFNKNKKMKNTKKKKKLKMRKLKWYKEIACVQPRHVSEHGMETRKLPIPDPLPNEPKTMEKISKFKQIVCVTQVSENGTKTIHVNVPRLPSKPSIAETISEFRIYVQEAIERHDRYKLHCCSTLGRHRFLSTGRIVSAPYKETGPIVINGRMNEFINSMAANDVTDQQPLKVVSILGSGCLGKTTLAKALYNRIGMQFDCRAFIRVSKKPDMKRLFRDLFLQLHQKMHSLSANCNELGISDNINKHLQNKRYLIVIDDLWDASVWDIINYAFPKGNCGSKIIITTQIEDVALTCCCDHSEHVFEMKPLDNDHSRKLFFNRIFGSERDCPEEFKQVSNEIIDICGGLPLATINIASHFANQVSMDLLAYTQDSLRSYLWSSSTSERTSQVLNLSYNNLPRYLKTCLLYLSMYPEGSIIYKDDLVKQWVAEGFIATGKGVEKDEDMMEKVAGICFDELIDRRFIQPIYTNYNNKVVSCTVHDVVHDLIAQKSAEENFIVIVDYNRKSIALSHKVRRLSLIFGDTKYAKTPANIRKSQVRSLRFFGLLECMPCIREFKILRVLNLQLSGRHGHYDPLDLTGISELSQLRYLKIASDSLAKNTVDDAGVSRMCIPYDGLSSVSVAPVHLQTLELSRHCCIFSRLPRCLGELVKLRILKIAVGELLKADIDILKGLPALTALSLHLPTISVERIVFGKGGFSVLTYLKFMCTVPWLKFEAHAMPNLKKLKLCFNTPIVDEQRATQIIIEHLSSSIEEISAKICCASVDARSALLKAIRSDPRNPEVQLMGSTYYGQEGRGMVAREGSGEDENKEAHSSVMGGASLPEYMTSAAAAQYAPAPLRMAMHERAPPQQQQPQQQQPQLQPVLRMWSSKPYKVDSGGQATSIMEPDAKFDHAGLQEDPQMDELETAGDADQEVSKPRDKVLRRLVHNREAARKSRLRKKAYIQQLELRRIKLDQLEQELHRARQQQGVYGGSNPWTSLQRHHGGGSAGLGFAAAGQMMDPGVAAFEIEYMHWVDEQKRHTEELRSALQQGQGTPELELQMMVDTGLANYDNLFGIKGAAAQSDVLCVMSGLWRSSAERIFLWIGGFRPSEVLKILCPQLLMTEQQSVAVYGLQLSSAQAEDVLSQGLQKLQQTVAKSLTDTGDPFMVGAMEKLKGLVGFVQQADHLRREMLQNMHRILTTRQAAKGLLVLGDYFQSLRALSTLWAARPQEPAIS